MRIYESESAERDWEREQRAEERYRRELYEAPAEADLAETGCTPEEIRLMPPMQASLFPDEMPERLQPVLVSRPRRAVRRG